LFAAGALLLVNSSNARPLRSRAFPRPPGCRGAGCRKQRHELFAATISVSQATTWDIPRADAGDDEGSCLRSVVSGSGAETLSFLTTKPVSATFVRAGREYGIGFLGHYDHGRYRAYSDFLVQGRLQRSGTVTTEYSPLEPDCAEPFTATVGGGPPDGDCGTIVDPWFLSVGLRRSLLSFSAYPNSAVASNNGRANGGFEYASCPAFGAEFLAPGGEPADVAVNLIRPVRSNVDLSAAFDCRRRVVTATTKYDVRAGGPAPSNYDPHDPAAPHWRSTTEIRIDTSFRRIGCGKG
jgi:hypothetical protein